MTVKEFMRRFKKTEASFYASPGAFEMRPAIVCDDGFSVSIQASAYHYCSPRESGLDEYEDVELGFPSESDELIADYAEDDTDPVNTVYPFVPIEIVEELIKKHGGIKKLRNEKTLVERAGIGATFSWTPFQHELM